MDNFLLIIGAMKSGTTSLFKYLAEHPNIAGSKPKEPNFFVDEKRWARGWEWYQSLWDWDPTRHKYAMEASTSYTKRPLFPSAAERIATAPGRYKFIYIMRNPMERIESHYTHGRLVGWETTKEPLHQANVDKQLIAVSSYAAQLDDYYKRFPREDIKLILYEDLKTRPVETVNEIYAFLGLVPTADVERIGVVYNKNKSRVNNPILKRLRWSGAGRAIWKPLPDKLKTRITASVGRTPSGKYRLSPEQKEEILATLMPDLRRLEADYGVDISRWGINP